MLVTSDMYEYSKIPFKRRVKQARKMYNVVRRYKVQSNNNCSDRTSRLNDVNKNCKRKLNITSKPLTKLETVRILKTFHTTGSISF